MHNVHSFNMPSPDAMDKATPNDAAYILLDARGGSLEEKRLLSTFLVTKGLTTAPNTGNSEIFPVADTVPEAG